MDVNVEQIIELKALFEKGKTIKEVGALAELAGDIKKVTATITDGPVLSQFIINEMNDMYKNNGLAINQTARMIGYVCEKIQGDKLNGEVCAAMGEERNRLIADGITQHQNQIWFFSDRMVDVTRNIKDSSMRYSLANKYGMEKVFNEYVDRPDKVAKSNDEKEKESFIEEELKAMHTCYEERDSSKCRNVHQPRIMKVLPTVSSEYISKIAVRELQAMNEDKTLGHNNTTNDRHYFIMKLLERSSLSDMEKMNEIKGIVNSFDAKGLKDMVDDMYPFYAGVACGFESDEIKTKFAEYLESRMKNSAKYNPRDMEYIFYGLFKSYTNVDSLTVAYNTIEVMQKNYQGMDSWSFSEVKKIVEKNSEIKKQQEQEKAVKADALETNKLDGASKVEAMITQYENQGVILTEEQKTQLRERIEEQARTEKLEKFRSDAQIREEKQQEALNTNRELSNVHEQRGIQIDEANANERIGYEQEIISLEKISGALGTLSVMGISLTDEQQAQIDNFKVTQNFYDKRYNEIPNIESNSENINDYSQTLGMNPEVRKMMADLYKEEEGRAK